MADNIDVEPSRHSNKVAVATDLVSSVHYPVYKMAVGGDGEANLISNLKPIPVSAGVGDLTIDAWGTQKVSHPVSLFHGLWTFDIPASMWFMYENSTQVYSSTAISSTDGAAKLLTTATETDLVLESRECPRYQPNRGHLFSTALWCPSKTADGVRHWGLSTDENGVGFKLKADGLLYASIVSDSVEVKEELIDTSDLTGFDVEKGNIYDIQYQWRGVGNYNFFIGNPATGVQQLVHQIAFLGTGTALTIQNPALPIHYHCERTTEDVEMHIGCADVTSENGLANNTEQYCSTYSENVTVNGTDAPVIVLKIPLLINSLTNTRTDTLARITVSCAKKATFKVWTTRDVTAFTNGVFKEVQGGTYVETDSTDNDATATRVTAIDTAKCNFVRAMHVEAAVSQSADNPYRGRIEFPLVRGDYLMVSCTASTTTADCDIEWGEQV